MNEQELREAFLNFVQVKQPSRFYPFEYVPEQRQPIQRTEIVVAKEAEYGTFDLVLFIRFGGEIRQTIPVELKSDEDKLDDRLRHQIGTALLTFGQCLLVLDEKQFKKAQKLRWIDVLPCEVWARNGIEFEQITSEIDYGAEKHLSISKRAIEKAFGIIEPKALTKLQIEIRKLQSFLATLEANQWRFNKEIRFTPDEAELARRLLGYKVLSDFIQKPLHDAGYEEDDFHDVRPY